MSAQLAEINLSSVNADAVELVEGLLERLKSGEAIAVAYVEVLRGRTVVIAHSDPGGSYHMLNSGAARLSLSLASECD